MEKKKKKQKKHNSQCGPGLCAPYQYNSSIKTRGVASWKCVKINVPVLRVVITSSDYTLLVPHFSGNSTIWNETMKYNELCHNAIDCCGWVGGHNNKASACKQPFIFKSSVLISCTCKRTEFGMYMCRVCTLKVIFFCQSNQIKEIPPLLFRCVTDKENNQWTPVTSYTIVSA